MPRSFLEEAAARSRSLQLWYELLGQREVIHLENPVAGDMLETPGGGGAVRAATERRYADGRGGVEESGGRRGGRGGGREEQMELLVPISVNHFRYKLLVCFATTHTEVHSLNMWYSQVVWLTSAPE